MSTARSILRPAVQVRPLRWPALLAALLFAFGIALHRALPAYPGVGLAALAALLFGAMRCRQAGVACVALSLSAIFAGTIAAQLAAYEFPSDAIAQFTADEPRISALELELLDAPKVIPGEGPRHANGRQIARAAALRAKTLHGWETTSGEVTFSFAQSDPLLVAGQRLRVLGFLSRPAPPTNPGAFDWQQYYRRQRVLAAVSVSRDCDLTILTDGHGASVGRFESALLSVRQRAREWLRAGFNPARATDRELLVALTLGDRTPAMRRVEDDCNTTGASHLLASSGLRIGTLMFCVLFICQRLRLRPRTTLILTTTTVCLLGIIMVPSAQALRPVLACAAVGAGVSLRRSLNSIQLLGLAALALLVARPLELYSAGFQLAFVVVLGLLVLTRPCFRWIESRLRNRDVDVLQQIGRMSRAQRYWRWIWRRTLEVAVAGVIAWVVSFPLVEYHFEQVNPWAVPLDLLFLPVTLVALGCGFVKIALTAALPFGAPAWAAVAGAPVWILHHGVSWSARVLPWADIPVRPPTPGAIMLFYLVLIAGCAWALLPQARARVRAGIRLAVSGAACMSLLLPMLIGFTPPGLAPVRASPGQTLRITVLSVGAGQCIAVEPPGGRIILLDAGSSSLSDPLRSCIGPFLRYEGRARVDELFLSHGDFDHISAAGGLLASYGLSDVIISPNFRRHATESVTCRRLLNTLDHSRHPAKLVSTGDQLDLGGGAKIEVLWPPADCPLNSNNAGLVLRLTFGGRSVLFPADIQAPAESELLRNPSSLRSDILLAPHHGSSEFTTADLVRAVHPRAIISSDDHHLTSKQRAFETMIGNTPLYRTGESGAVTVTIDRAGPIRIEPFVSSSGRRPLDLN